VLKSNIAACHLKLEDWKEAVKAASAALDGLDRLQGKSDDAKEEGKGGDNGEEADEEIISEGATKAEDVSNKGQREVDIERIRAKALMRRARARSEQGGWATLQGAEEGLHFLICVWLLGLTFSKIIKRYHRCQIYPQQTERLLYGS
jgi:hypothetical protein